MAGIGQWQPAQGSHAIQMAAATITFSEGITTMLLEAAEGAAFPLAKEFGLDERVPLQEFVGLDITPNGPQPQAQFAGSEILRRERPDFYSDKITIGRNVLRYEEWSYTRWAVMLDKFARLISLATPSYTTATMISGISVEYIDDVFLAAPESTDSINLVIDERSPFVASGAISDTGLWHTHSGFFEARSDGSRRLHQINIDVSDTLTPDGPKRDAQIRTYAADQPHPMPSSALTGAWGEIAERFDSLHDCVKRDFAAILTTEAAAAASLG